MASLLQPTAPGFNGASCTVPEPILSSQSRQWNGIVVELYRVRDVDFVKQDSAHNVAVFLRGPVNLVQRRGGGIYQRTLHAGDVIIAPAGEPRALRHQEETELVKLRLTPSFVAGIIEDSVTKGSGPVELLDTFGARDARIEDIARRLVGEIKAETTGATVSHPQNQANFQVPEEDGEFCDRGGRFGPHSTQEEFGPPFYQKIVFVSYFNAGVRAIDVRDPFNPAEVGFYIPATTANTDYRCKTSDPATCKIAIQTNNLATDDRGYIYIADRANTGVHILRLSGSAKNIIAP